MSQSSRLVIAGMGPGDPGLVPELTISRAKSAEKVFVRTENHPSIQLLKEKGILFDSFDFLYETAANFDELYEEIAKTVLDSAMERATVYLLPGHPFLAERSVEIILRHVSNKLYDDIDVEVIPAMGFAEAVLSALKEPAPSGYCLLDAYEIYKGNVPDVYLSHLPCIIFQVHDRLMASCVKIWLLEFLPSDYRVYLVKAACVREQEEVIPVALEDLDRVREPDPLTSVFIPPIDRVQGLETRLGERFYRLPSLEGAWTRFISILSRLRGENGCPWDKEQTYQTLTRYVLEEAYEVVSAALEKDVNKLKEELGDLLLEVGLYSQIAKERKDFTIVDVLKCISEKLIRRHPHVFGEENLSSPEEVRQRWLEIKKQEPGRCTQGHSLMDEVDKALPALMKAQKQQSLASQVGFDWDSVEGVLEKVKEEIEELKRARVKGDKQEIAAEIGDLFFACVNLARHLEVDAETALLASVDKFSRRFRKIEGYLKSHNLTMKDVNMELLNRLWEQAKEGEGSGVE